MIARQRALLSKGEGDVEAYCAKADAYFAGYKWDHKGHTNSFSALMSNDIVIREQKDYLDAQGLAWTPRASARDTPKERSWRAASGTSSRASERKPSGRSTP